MEMQLKDQQRLSGKGDKKQLFLKQKKLLDTFLQHGAITAQQHDKSLHDLTVKMGFMDDTQP